ncbi:MAG: GNAT family N-acetyltransferase [Desulfobacterales bacterium]|nr:GNAT family N-acetyltransferase [Desulfobacterales bacterium]
MKDPFIITPVETEEALGEIRLLFREYANSLDFDLSFQNFEEELAGLPGRYAPPDGCLLMARVGNEPAGCAALRKIENGICEMKRLYVRPRFRGARMGKALASEIVARARRIGFERMRLDTAGSMEKAKSIYVAMGFREIAPYCHNPLPDATFLELTLNSELMNSELMKHISKILGLWLKPLKTPPPPLHLVGGTVRDFLLSKTPKDIDLVCPDAESTARKLAAANNAAFVPFLKKADQPCYRIVDRDRPDNFLDIAPLYGGDLDTDLRRRDFTINAMAVSVDRNGVPGDIIDLMDGAGDLKNKIIRITGPRVLADDPLRILRAFRFAAKLDFSIEETTLASIEANAKRLEITAFERIMSELLQIFHTPRAARTARWMDRLCVLEIIFPEILPMKGCVQNQWHHLDVWSHSLAVLENCERIIHRLPEYFGPSADQVRANLNRGSRIPLLKLGAMLHDVGKPSKRGVNKNTGRIIFYDHEKAGGQIMTDITRRLRVSKSDREFLQALIVEHMHVLHLAQPGVKATTRVRWFRKLREDVIPLIIHGMADILSTLGPESSEEYRDNYIRWSQTAVNEYFQSLKPQLERPSLISGADLIVMGVAPGPRLGRLLKKIRDAQDAGEVKNREEALALVKKLKCPDSPLQGARHSSK